MFTLWNVLALANLAFAVVGLALNSLVIKSKQVRSVRPGDWAVLCVIAVVSGGIAPAMLFSALADQSVAGVVVLSRIEPPLTLFLAAALLGVQANALRTGGAFLVFCGVLLTVMLQGPMGHLTKTGLLQIGTGELQAIGAGMLLSITTVAYQMRLAHVPISIYVVARAFICTVFFLVVGAAVQTDSLFSAMATAGVWPYLGGYIAVFGVAAPLFWVIGLRRLHPATVSVAVSTTPFLAVIIAARVLGQLPTMAEIVGGSLVALGLIMTIVGAMEDGRRGRHFASVGSADEFDSGLGFKGV